MFVNWLEASFWTAEEIGLTQDNRDWESLIDSERHFIKHVQALLAASEVKRKFICETLSCDLIGMNSELMTRYIKFVDSS